MAVFEAFHLVSDWFTIVACFSSLMRFGLELLPSNSSRKSNQCRCPGCVQVHLFHVVSTINPHSVHCLRFVLSVPVGLLSCERDSSRWMEVSSVCAKSNTLSVPLHLCLSYATPLLFLLQLLPVTHHSGKHMQPS